MLAGISTQILWITFAPILPLAVKAYHVGEAEIGYLSAVFPLVYIVASIPVGYFIDKHGFRKAVLLGMFFLGVFGFLRAFTSSYSALLLLQTITALGQPLIMNSVSKLVGAWFPEDEAALATGLGTLSLEVGIIMGIALTPQLAGVIGLKNTLIAYGVFSLLVLVLFYALGKEPARKIAEERVSVSGREFIRVFKNRNIILLSLLFFLGVGVYTAFTTWVEPILTSRGVSMETAGVLGGVLTLGGILGSIVIPGISDKYRTRKKPLLIALLISIVLWYLPSMIHGAIPLGVELFILGFFSLSLAPLALELSVESVGKQYAGAANAALWELSQIGSLLLIIVFEDVGKIYGWSSMFPFISILAVVMLLISAMLRE